MKLVTLAHVLEKLRNAVHIKERVLEKKIKQSNSIMSNGLIRYSVSGSVSTEIQILTDLSGIYIALVFNSYSRSTHNMART